MAVATPACRRCARAQSLCHPHSLLSPCQPCACTPAMCTPSPPFCGCIKLNHAALYICLYCKSPKPPRWGLGAHGLLLADRGGWLAVLLPILHPIGPARSNVHKSDKHGHPPPPPHPIGCCCPCVHTHARASIIQAWRLMRDSLIQAWSLPEHHEIPSYVIAGELYEG